VENFVNGAYFDVPVIKGKDTIDTAAKALGLTQIVNKYKN
jgi:hypothetical protein